MFNQEADHKVIHNQGGSIIRLYTIKEAPIKEAPNITNSYLSMSKLNCHPQAMQGRWRGKGRACHRPLSVL